MVMVRRWTTDKSNGPTNGFTVTASVSAVGGGARRMGMFSKAAVRGLDLVAVGRASRSMVIVQTASAKLGNLASAQARREGRHPRRRPREPASRKRPPVVPKPMLEIGGRPVLWHIMKIYAHQGSTSSSSRSATRATSSSDTSSNPGAQRSLHHRPRHRQDRLARGRSHDWKIHLIETGWTR